MIHIDGTLDDGFYLAGDGKNAPFYLFDDERQENVAGPYPFRWVARIARWLRSRRQV